jgi:hypothetical protein
MMPPAGKLQRKFVAFRVPPTLAALHVFALLLFATFRVPRPLSAPGTAPELPIYTNPLDLLEFDFRKVSKGSAKSVKVKPFFFCLKTVPKMDTFPATPLVSRRPRWRYRLLAACPESSRGWLFSGPGVSPPSAPCLESFPASRFPICRASCRTPGSGAFGRPLAAHPNPPQGKALRSFAPGLSKRARFAAALPAIPPALAPRTCRMCGGAGVRGIGIAKYRIAGLLRDPRPFAICHLPLLPCARHGQPSGPARPAFCPNSPLTPPT